MKWYFKCFKQYADFSSRARRKEFWWFTVINFIIMMILGIGFMMPFIKLGYSTAMAGGGMEDIDETEMVVAVLKNPFVYIYLIYYLAVLVPSIAVFVRRLHDIGRSGYWVLLYYGAGLLAQIVSAFSQTQSFNPAVAVTFLVLLAVAIIFLVWLFTDSQYGPNQWGPNPKGEGNPEESAPASVETQE